MSKHEMEAKEGLPNEVAALSVCESPRLTNAIGRFLAKHEIQFQSYLAKTLDIAQRGIDKFPVAFLTTDLGARYRRGMSLSPLFELQSVRFPPLIVMVDERPSPEDLEYLRNQGVCMVVSGDWHLEQDTEAILSLVKSPSWLQVQSEFVPLQEVLGMIERNTNPAMLVLSCSSDHQLSDQVWGSAGDLDLQGRIYMDKGRISLCETPDLLGVEALARMLRMETGRIWVHRQFLAPQTPQASDCIENYLIKAFEYNIDLEHQQVTKEPLTQYDTVPNDDEDTEGDDDASFNSVLGSLIDEVDELVNDSQIDEKIGGSDMIPLQPLLDTDASLLGLTLSDSQGNPNAQTGEIDAEMVCAISALGHAAAQEICEVLGLGSLKGWAIGSEKSALYTCQTPEGQISALGKGVKNPEVILKKVVQQLN